MDGFRKGERCGVGTFGTVHKATCLADGSTVAIKKIRNAFSEQQGVSMAAIREIKTLRDLQHENIVVLLEVFIHKSSVKLVFEFLETDLECVMEDQTCTIGPADIKSFMLMIMRGLAYLHAHEILPRDIKPNNLLISADGILKIADFGRAKDVPEAFSGGGGGGCGCGDEPASSFTSQVVMLPFRAPELLCGAQRYGPGVDVWACAVIMAEMVTRKTFFRGERDVSQLCEIKNVLGAPGKGALDDMGPLPEIVRGIFPAQGEEGCGLAAHFEKEGFPEVTECSQYLELLQAMLVISPRVRLSAADVLQVMPCCRRCRRPCCTRPCCPLGPLCLMTTVRSLAAPLLPGLSRADRTQPAAQAS